jgi:hypothetical protein
VVEGERREGKVVVDFDLRFFDLKSISSLTAREQVRFHRWRAEIALSLLCTLSRRRDVVLHFLADLLRPLIFPRFRRIPTRSFRC